MKPSAKKSTKFKSVSQNETNLNWKGLISDFEQSIGAQAKNYDSIKSSLELIHSALTSSNSGKGNWAWTYDLESLIYAMKKWILYEFKQSESCADATQKPADFDNDNATTSNLIYNSFELILSRIVPKDSYNFLSSLLTLTKPGDFDLLQFLYSSESKISRVPLNSKLIDLIKNSVSKAAPMLKMGETKSVAHSHIPYTSFSANVGRILEDLIIYTLEMIKRDDVDEDSEMKLKIFNLLVALSNVAPFSRLSQDLFDRILSFLLEFLASPNESESKYRQYYLPLLINVLSTNWESVDESSVPHLAQFQSISTYNSIISACFSSIKAWILNYKIITSTNLTMSSSSETEATEKIIENVKAQHAAVLLDFEAIGALATHHFSEIKEEFINIVAQLVELLKEMIEENTNNKNSTVSDLIIGVKVKGITLMHTLTSCTEKIIKTEMEKPPENSESDVDEGEGCKREIRHDLVKHWKDFLSILPSLSNDQSNEVLYACIDSFATIGEELFSSLEDKCQSYCLISLINYCNSEDIIAKGKGARGLAVFLEFKCLFSDCGDFILRSLEIISDNYSRAGQLPDISFSWALSNLLDTLSKYPGESFSQTHAQNIFLKASFLCIQMTQDSPKIRYNGNRGLGALVKWYNPDYASISKDLLNQKILEISLVLCKQVGSGSDFKSRWNAAYALGNLLRNQNIWPTHHHLLSVKYDKKIELIRQDSVFKVLVHAIKSSNNYKERIYCVKGISGVLAREHLGSNYEKLLSTFLGAFQEISYSEPDPHGLVQKYQSELTTGILHLIELLTPYDLDSSSSISVTFLENIEAIEKIHVAASYYPNNEEVLQNIGINLKKITNSTTERNECLNLLASYFLDVA